MRCVRNGPGACYETDMQKVRSSSPLLLSLSLLTVLAGCGGGASGGSPSPDPTGGTTPPPSSTGPGGSEGGGGGGTVSDLARAPQISQAKPPAQFAKMPLISLGRPTFATYAQADAPLAVDNDYGTSWRTYHVPTAGAPDVLAIDLSGLPLTERSAVYSVWFNENGYNYDTSDAESYTLPGDYQIQASTASGGGAPPQSGWVTLVTVKGNTLSSRADVLDLTGYQWVRFFCTASAPNAAAQNTDVSLQWNLYDAHAGVDGWKFGGDSITANSMGHKSTNDSFDQLVHAQVPDATPAFEMGGHGGWTTTDMLGHIDAYLANFPGRYFALPLGTNDAGNDPVGYAANMTKLIDKILAVGKVPVVPTIPYTGDPQHAAIPSYNAQIQQLYATYGAKLVQGPDLYAVLYAGRATMFDNPTDLHPNEKGNAAIRKAWGDAMVKNVYAK